jgi:hypothetical protein
MISNIRTFLACIVAAMAPTTTGFLGFVLRPRR